MLQSNFAIGDNHAVRNIHQSLHNMPKRQDTTVLNGQVVSVVYVTAAPTFTGVLGGGTSDDGGSAASSTSVRSATAAATSSSSSRSQRPVASSASVTESSQPTGANIFSEIMASQSSQTTSDAESQTSMVAATNTRSVPYSTGTNSAGTSSSSTDSSSSSSSSSEGMSTAGKAGLAAGIILAIGAVLCIILFLLSKKKKQAKADRAREDSEKNGAMKVADKTGPDAPRLSLRPASSFLPEFMGGARPKSRLSQGDMLGAQNSETNPAREKYLAGSNQQSIPMTEKPLPAENPFRDPENPFADPVRAAPQPLAHAHAQGPIVMPEPERNPEPIPVPEPYRVPVTMPSPRPDDVSDKIAVSAASTGAVAAAQAAMRNTEQSRHGRQPGHIPNKPIEMPSPPMPGQVPLRTSSPALQAGAAPATEGNVYRILMDFIPSMEDELDLKAGNVVRMLHEYDDGWCLCARLDRSQQGAVPRTCLAAKPSKPRPGTGPRPMSPAMGPPMRSGPPPQGRPMSPGMGRPMSPGMGRSMSPGPHGTGPMGQSMSPGPRNGPTRNSRPMSPGAYNQPPRPLSPGPRASKRSMSPGPYGMSSGPTPMAPPNQRRRSNSSSQTAREVRDRRLSPPGPSPLNAAAVPGIAM